MKHSKRPFKPDLMTVLLLVVSLGVLLTMIAQAGEMSPSAPSSVYQLAQLR